MCVDKVKSEAGQCWLTSVCRMIWGPFPCAHKSSDVKFKASLKMNGSNCYKYTYGYIIFEQIWAVFFKWWEYPPGGSVWQC